MSVSCTALCFALTCILQSAHAFQISNGIISAVIDGQNGLSSVSQGPSTVTVAADEWEVIAFPETPRFPSPGAVPLNLSASSPDCQFGSCKQQPAKVDCTWICGVVPLDREIPRFISVIASYSVLPDTAFVQKQMTVKSSRPRSNIRGSFFLQSVSPFRRLVITSTGPLTGIVQNNTEVPYSIAGFARLTKQSGVFVTVANPFTTISLDTSAGTSATFSATYKPGMAHNASFGPPAHVCEPAILGLTNLSTYFDSVTGLNLGERRAFADCVDSMILDKPARQKSTIKVNIGWDENDYQIDVGTDAGWAEYQRIILQNEKFGVSHIVFAPQNSRYSSRVNTSDDWGWDHVLWLSFGQQFRQGAFDPTVDTSPQDIVDMVSFASVHGIKLMAYIYPTLFNENSTPYLIDRLLDLSPPEVFEKMLHFFVTFVNMTGVGGFAWDYNIFAGPSSLQYPQWRAWMYILKGIRTAYPDVVMDHRQTNHMWGPWYQLAGSYAEPLASDENPESYGADMPSLHTDHTTANHVRAVNHWYMRQQLQPSSRVPGFIFHQTERSDDNGTFPCHGSEPCYPSNTRDFDYLGYKYSLLSSISTAGLNNVFAMIPARDQEEFDLLPQHDLEFIQKWLKFTDDHQDCLQHTQPIYTLPPPTFGSIDGTACARPESDFAVVFLFNPNYIDLTTSITLDDSIGLSSASAGSHWTIVEAFPREGATVGVILQGAALDVSVAGSNAKVLLLTRTDSIPTVQHAVNVTGPVAIARGSLGALIVVENVQGVPGSTATHTFDISSRDVLGGTSRVRINGLPCRSVGELTVSNTTKSLVLQAQVWFDPSGTVTSKTLTAIPVSPDRPPSDFTGGWFNTTINVPSRVRDQLRQRTSDYPINWEERDMDASWLAPSRLLLYPFLTRPNWNAALSVYVNDVEKTVQRAFSSRGLIRDNCFLGNFVDLTDITVGQDHRLAVFVPPVGAGEFQGVFWENVEQTFTADVTECVVQRMN
eukprot:c16008_g1_i1.p1 GENE.c16008_g1_i1~~c16008_g1_i1.p1  ORF type:complete len:999 (-),score=182.04 c16008_g1_i1:1048-4011(-)